MVKVSGEINYESDGKAKVSLFADTKDEVISGMDVKGLPKGIQLAAGSSCITADKEFAFLKSDGTWNW